jgi:hypothetical protein
VPCARAGPSVKGLLAHPLQRIGADCGLEAREHLPVGCVYAHVGSLIAVIQTFGVDPKQHLDAVPGAFGDLRRGYPGVEPQRHGSVRKS